MWWRVPKMWEGGECWIIGGGASMPKEFGVPEDLIEAVANDEVDMSAFSPYLAPIHDKHCIAINIAFLLGNWVEMMFFGDQRFFLEYKHRMVDYSGLKVTCYPGLQEKKFAGYHLKHLKHDRIRAKGISSDPHCVCWNGNSGAAAISVAANAGATKIILLGFDMKLDDKQRSHFHKEYTKGKITSASHIKPHKLPFYKHLVSFPQIKRDADARGIKIINASPDSAIVEFPKVSVKELLKL